MTKQTSKLQGIQERAMLVKFTVSRWDGRKRDDRVTQDVSTTNHAENDAGAWWTHLISRKALAPTRNAEVRGRIIHNKQTLPWNDVGYRILPAANFLEYTKRMRKAQRDFDDAVRTLIDEYPSLLASAKDRLGELFYAEWYPEPHELAPRFAWGIDIMPLPTGGDFRVDLGSTQTTAIQQHIDRHVTNKLASATHDLWQRLYDAVNKLADRLSDTDRVIRASLLTNLQELCELLPRLNITQNAKLTAMSTKIAKKVKASDLDHIRNDDTARASAAKATKVILDQMAGYMGDS